MDDAGPLLVGLEAVSILQDLGLQSRRTVRFVTFVDEVCRQVACAVSALHVTRRTNSHAEVRLRVGTRPRATAACNLSRPSSTHHQPGEFSPCSAIGSANTCKAIGYQSTAHREKLGESPPPCPSVRRAYNQAAPPIVTCYPQRNMKRTCQQPLQTILPNPAIGLPAQRVPA